MATPVQTLGSRGCQAPQQAPYYRASRPYVAVFVVLVLIGVGRIISTYSVFNQTADEPAHIACGMQWLDRGRYDYELQHPPLARIASALGLYLAGGRSTGNSNMWLEGRALLYSGGAYDRNLALARAGILPFFVFGSFVVWLWTLRLFGAPAALAGTFLFTTLPPILAHSGLATTDMAVAACLSAALCVLTFWMERPTVRLTLLLGVCLGLATLSKFSTVVFFPVCAASVILLRIVLSLRSRPRRLPNVSLPAQEAAEVEPPPTGLRGSRRLTFRHVGLCALVALLVVWSGYRFSIVPLAIDEKVSQRLAPLLAAGSSVAPAVHSLIMIPIPCAQLFVGVATILHHNASGHPSYLLGQYGTNGWWYFFPVVLAVKTPLSFLLAGVAGFVALFRNRELRRHWLSWAPLCCAAAILGVSMLSRIDLGVRHILVIYPLIAVVAGHGLAVMLTSRWFLIVPATALALAQVVSSAAAHPDYLAYFSVLAGRSPESVLSESDLDWGQDLKRLKTTAERFGIKELSLAYAGTADPSRMGLPAFKPLEPYVPTSGWIAISLYHLKVTGSRLARESGKSDLGYSWLDVYKPVAMVGKSIRLYYVRD